MSCSGCPSQVLHLADSGWLTYSCGGRFCGVGGVLVLHLVFYLVPAQLPPSSICCLPFAGAAPFPAPVCGSTSVVRLEGYLLYHLVFSHVPCSSSGPAACAAFPAAGYLGVFRSPGVCPSSSLVTLVGLQPFPSFSVHLLLHLLAGVGWVMHLVSGCSSCGGVCLG